MTGIHKVARATGAASKGIRECDHSRCWSGSNDLVPSRGKMNAGRTSMTAFGARPKPGFAGRLRLRWFGGLGALLILLSTGLPRAIAALSTNGMVAAVRGDPYRVLAEEIARETGYPVVDSPVTALQSNPVFLIWVMSPAMASDRDFVAYGQAVKNRKSEVALGVITGGTLEKARQLWRRRNQVSALHPAAINGASLPASVSRARIVTWPSGQRTETPLTLESLRHCLGESDCVSFTGHGTATSLILDDSTRLRADGVPPLPPLVVSTANCNTLRFWNQRSIALAFVDQGAAAYIGFVYSPNAGYLLGAYEGLPFRYTWPEFTVGQVVQVLNRGCQQGFAAFPYYHVIGDPRMALSNRPPYEIVEDKETGNLRRITARNAPASVIPVRVRNGAEFDFVRIPGVGAASVHDLFYNSRIQMADLGADRLILFLHMGGDFVIELQRKAPVAWKVSDTVLDSLDQGLICNSQNSGDIIQLVLGGIIFACVGWRNRRGHKRAWTAAILTGTLFAMLLAGYAGLRHGAVTINSKPVVFSWLAIPGTFLITAGASLLYVSAQKIPGRILALLLACSAQFLTVLGTGLFLLVFKMRITQRLGAALWNYKLVLLNLITLLVILPLVLILFELLRRRVWGMGRKASGSHWPANGVATLRVET